MMILDINIIVFRPLFRSSLSPANPARNIEYPVAAYIRKRVHSAAKQGTPSLLPSGALWSFEIVSKPNNLPNKSEMFESLDEIKGGGGIQLSKTL